MKRLLIISFLFMSVSGFAQMDKLKLHQTGLQQNKVINNNFDSLDARITTLVDSGTLVSTVEFKDITYDTINSQYGYIIWCADSCWIERPRGTIRRRLDE